MKQIIALAYKAETGDFSADELATAAWHYGRSKPVLKSLDGNVEVPVVASYIWPTDPIAIDYADGSTTVISKGDWVIDVQLDAAAEVLYNHGLIAGLRKEWDESVHPRDEHGRFGSGNDGLDIPALAHDAGEGFSIDPHTGKSPTTGYMVARSQYGTVIDTKTEADTAKALRDFADKHAHLFEEDKSLYLGGWRDQATGKFYLDVVDNVKDEDKAVALGRNRDQISVFNIETFQEIKTGGTGEGNGKPEFDRHPDDIFGEGTVVRKSARELHPAFGQREGRLGDGSSEEDSELLKEWSEDAHPRDETGKFASSATADTYAAKIAERAAIAEPQLTATMKSIAEATGGQLHGLDHRMKTPESLARKIASDAANNYGGNLKLAAEAVSDANRYTVIANPTNYSNAVSTAISTLRDEGYNVADDRVKNYWVEGNNYKGVNVAMVTPEGDKVELQFHTPDSAYLKESLNHPLYEEYRNLPKDDPRAIELNNQMISNSAQLDVPHGVQDIGTLKVAKNIQRKVKNGG